MSYWATAQSEAGPSSGPSLFNDPKVRRSKTVGYAPSTHSRSSSTSLSVSTLSTLDELALPIQLSNVGRRSSIATSELRMPAISPSKRGETLRAYSRQRRVFSGHDNGAATSPEHFARPLPSAYPASPSLRRPPSSRNYNGPASTSDAPASGLLFSSSSDDSQGIPFASLGDEVESSLSSTPSLTSPTSTLSRSTSLRSAQSERIIMMGGARYTSLNGSADLPTAMEGLSQECGTSDWTRRARRWSNSMSSRMSISALNQTIHSTTSPYLKAGLQELRSIFDVDTLGLPTDADNGGERDLEGASSAERRTPRPSDTERFGLFGATLGPSAAALSRDEAVFESPDAMTPILSRQSSSETRETSVETQTKRPAISFKSQVYEAPVAHRRGHSWRKHRSLSVSHIPNHPTITTPTNKNAVCSRQASSAPSSARESSTSSQSVRTPLVAVGLAALSVSIVGVCAFETSIHPDAASLPLTAFMLAQSLFTLVGITGLALQKRWLIDLASRLIRAHVLCQVLIALAALRSLSRTAFYRDRVDRQSYNGTASAGVIASSQFLSASADKINPHMSSVGSFRDQLTYVSVFIVQAALPLAFVLWAQYSIASALSRATRHLPLSGSNKEHKEQQRQLSVPMVTVAGHDAAPRSERMRFNSENPSNSSKTSPHGTIGSSGTASRRSEGWLGFVITRVDSNPIPPATPKFELDADELTNRLNALARTETPTLSPVQT